MQAIWKGTVSFGLVSIPVRLYAATEERGVSFRQVHEEDGGRIKYKRVCSVDGEEVPYSQIGKGFEMPDGDIVVLTDEDFASLPLPSRRTIEVLQFVPAEQIDGSYLSKPYYLAADGAGTKPYVLLRDALERSGRAALVKVALRNRESLALLRPRDGALMVQTMLWPDEVRDPAAFVPTEDVAVRDQEIAMAESYIATLSDDFDPGAFTDDYRAALEAVVQAKAGGMAVAEPDETPAETGTVVDLMAALRASVEAAQRKRDGAPAAAATASPASPSKRAATQANAAKSISGKSASPVKKPTKAPAKRAAAAKSTTALKSDTPPKRAARKSA